MIEGTRFTVACAKMGKKVLGFFAVILAILFLRDRKDSEYRHNYRAKDRDN